MHCFAFALPCLLERIAVTCYGLLPMALLCFLCGRELSHVPVCFALFVGEGSCHTLRFALFCFVWVCLVFLVRGKTVICYDLLCSALLRFALHCSFAE